MRRALAVACLIVAAACGGGGTEEGAGEATDAPAAGATLIIESFAFGPVTAGQGETVRVVNEDPENHQVVADDDSFDSGVVTKGQPGSLTAPSTAGPHPFHCGIHPSMKGTLVVS